MKSIVAALLVAGLFLSACGDDGVAPPPTVEP